MERKMDRRTSRTRRALQDAFQELILEKGYDAVTVEEITDRANLGRTTFYLHYKDKEDLLLGGFSELVDELIKQLSVIPLSAWRLAVASGEVRHGSVRPIVMIFQHVDENRDLYRLVLRGEGVIRVAEQLRQIVTNAINNFLTNQPDEKDLILKMQVPLDVFSNFFAGALIGLITWWLGTDMPYTPEEMARMFQKLFLPGARRVMELN